MRRGATQVREFFETIYTSVEVWTFEPREFVVGGWAGRIKTTGRGYASDWVMAWTVKNGKVTTFRSYEDTHVMASVFDAGKEMALNRSHESSAKAAVA
jgi:ketosteroid isomerase-like protein